MLCWVRGKEVVSLLIRMDSRSDWICREVTVVLSTGPYARFPHCALGIHDLIITEII